MNKLIADVLGVFTSVYVGAPALLLLIGLLVSNEISALRPDPLRPDTLHPASGQHRPTLPMRRLVLALGTLIGLLLIAKVLVK